jgi:hypothetical protein
VEGFIIERAPDQEVDIVFAPPFRADASDQVDGRHPEGHGFFEMADHFREFDGIVLIGPYTRRLNVGVLLFARQFPKPGCRDLKGVVKRVGQTTALDFAKHEFVSVDDVFS